MSEYLNKVYLEYYDFKEILPKYILDGLIENELKEIENESNDKIPEILSLLLKNMLKYTKIVFTNNNFNTKDNIVKSNINKSNFLLVNQYIIKSSICNNENIYCYAFVNTTTQNMYPNLIRHVKKITHNNNKKIQYFLIDYMNTQLKNDIKKYTLNYILYKSLNDDFYNNKNYLKHVLNENNKKIKQNYSDKALYNFEHTIVQYKNNQKKVDDIIDLYNNFLIQKITKNFKLSILNSFYYQNLQHIIDQLLFYNVPIDYYIDFFKENERFNEQSFLNKKMILEDKLLKNIQKTLIKELLGLDNIEYKNLTKSQKIIIDKEYQKYILKKTINCEHNTILNDLNTYLRLVESNSLFNMDNKIFIKLWNNLQKYYLLNITDNIKIGSNFYGGNLSLLKNKQLNNSINNLKNKLQLNKNTTNSDINNINDNINDITDNTINNDNINDIINDISIHFNDVNLDNVNYKNDQVCCNICDQTIFCKHILTKINKLINNNGDVYKANKEIIAEFSTDLTTNNNYIYCKLCGSLIGNSINDESILSLVNSGLSYNSGEYLEEELMKNIYKQINIIVKSYVNIRVSNISTKIIVGSIFNMIKNYILELNSKISKYKDETEDKQKIRVLFHIKLYIFISLIIISTKTKAINFIDEKKKNNDFDIKNLLNIALTIFIKSNTKMIKFLRLNNVDIKNLMLLYYKNLSSNMVQFDNENNNILSFNILQNPYYNLIVYYNNIYCNKKLNIAEFFETNLDNDIALKDLSLQPFSSKINNLKEYKKNAITLFLYKLKNLDIINNNKNGENNKNSELIHNLYKTYERIENMLLEYQKLESVNTYKKIPLMPYYKNVYKFTNFLKNLDDEHINITYNYEKENFNLFFEIYAFKCPIINSHEFQNSKCTKCKITIEKLKNRDEEYYKEYKNVFIKNIINIKKNKQNNLNNLFNNKKNIKTNVKSKLENISLNGENIKKLSDIINIDIIYLNMLGAIEKLDYNVKSLNIKPVNGISRIFKLKNYIYWFIIQLNILTKTYKLNINILKKYEDYLNSNNNDDIVNILLNVLFEIVLDSLSSYKNNKLIYDKIKEIFAKILEFDELLTNYNYGEIRILLRKGYTSETDTLLENDKDVEHEMDESKNNYNDVFESSLFVEA